MIRWIIDSSLRLRFLILVLAIVLTVFGFTELRKMPVDVYPEFNPPLVEVQTEALGLSAAEVESLITLPMEADLLNGVAWLDQLYSESVAGLSRVLLIFEPGSDELLVRQMVQERLTQAHALPNVSKPPVMLQPLSASNRVMMVGLSSTDLSLIDMSVVAHWNIRPKLMGLPGVANVAIWGQRDQQLQVQVDPKTLHEKGVTLDQIIETSGEALWVSPLSYLESSSPGTAGWIDTPNQRLSIQHILPIISPEDLAKVPVIDETNLLLGDVAKIVTDHQPLIGDAILNDGIGLLMVVEKFPGASAIEVTKAVEQAFQDLAPGLTGITVDTTVFRPANYIEVALGNLTNTLTVAGILVVVALLFLFFNWRMALVSALTIGISLVLGTYVLYLCGVPTLNMMVLAGLALALVVIIDDAIVDVDNIARRLRQQRLAGNDKSTFATVLDAVMESRSTAFFATLALVVAVMPIYFMQGLAGSFLQPLVVTYLWVVITSLVVGMVVAHGLALLLLDNAKDPGRYVQRASPVLSALEKVYTGIVGITLRSPMVALSMALAFIMVGLLAFLIQSRTLLPAINQTELLVRWNAAPGTSRTQMNRSIGQASNELRTIPGVRTVGAHVGRAITGDQVVSINAGEIWVSLDTAADHAAAMKAIRETVAGYPGLLTEVQLYQPELTDDALLGATKDLTVRVYGHEEAVLVEKVQEISKLLVEQVPGLVDVQAELPVQEPEVQIEVNLANAEKHQVKPGEVRRQASALISGIQVGNLYQEQKVFDVVVWGEPALRNSVTNLQNMLIDTPNGQVALKEVAEVRIVPATTIIRRDKVARFLDVTANLNGTSLAAATTAINEKLAALTFPLEHHAEVLAESAARAAARQQTLYFVLAALFGIFLLVQAVTQKWSMAALTFVTLPMALTGGAIAALLGGGGFTLGALFGFFAILAIALRHTFASIKHFQQLEQETGLPFGLDLVNRGSSDRFGPILVTTITTILAFAPFIFLGNIAGHEMVRPMAAVIIGGLITSALFNLLVVPSLYLRYGQVTETEFVDALNKEPASGFAAAD
ncbi:MAG: efflux RND transporter permease subunit [Caldilineaceae bacterium]